MAAAGEWFEDWAAADPDGALTRARQPSLFDRADWYRLTREHVIHEPPAILRVGDEGGGRAWLMLRAKGHAAEPFASWYSLRFGPVFDRSASAGLLDALARALARRFAVIRLYPLETAIAEMLESALRETGWRVFRAPVSRRWIIDLNGRDFTAYWAERPGRLRGTVERRLRSHPIDIRIFRCFDPNVWRDYEQVYRASWKPEEGSFPFLRALAEQEGAAGTLRLGIGRDRSGRPIAAQLWQIENGVATIHKLAHREDAREGSPGSLLSYAMFRAAIDEDWVERIDFGLGDEPYKADWMERAEPVWRIDAYRPFTPAGLAGIGREIASHLVQRGKDG